MSQTIKERSTRAQMADRALALLKDPKQAQLKSHLGHVSKAGMQTLLGAVQRAESLDEIEIVIKYQQARSQEQKGKKEDGTWNPNLVDHLIQIMRTAAPGGSDDSQQAKAAWQQLALVARVHRVIVAQDKTQRPDDEEES